MLDFSGLEIAPEDYETHVLEKIPDSIICQSEMHEVERRFVNGLIRLIKPRNILEIGVSAGAGSVVILNAITDLPESKLYSYDIMKSWYMDESKKVGFCVDVMWPNGNTQWSLNVGKDVSHYVDEFSCKFDFVIIDTAHVHPVESLNFISVLPYLNDNAVVVFHDIALYTRYSRFDKFPGMPLANKLAYDTIVGKKLEPNGKDYLDFNLGIPSIGAVQICEITREYIGGLFNMLYFPWWSFSGTANYVFAVADIVQKHYSNKMFEKFCNSVSINARLEYNDFEYKPWNEKAINDLLQSDRIVFYGAGKMCSSLLQIVKDNGWRKPYLILDRNASEKEALHGIPVETPSSHKYSDENAVFVVTIKNQDVFNEIKEEIISANKEAKVYNYKDFYLAIVYDRISAIMRK